MKIAPLRLFLTSLATHFEILKANIEMNWRKFLFFFLKGEGYAYKFERLGQQIQLADCYNMIVISPCMGLDIKSLMAQISVSQFPDNQTAS